ncbi:Sel1 repeat [Seminavis robusta]|uniref:Sel1 repeat n=1 Tax=Seminavis robusta TaxID=568900 RepID=A0A9N8EZ22_9STRA|nr:Sel1 repeat [Seminavis robusta]|eukprot:Sro2598_g332210.1 Sel1 repeat (285) ;mRNA; f:8849-9703
MSDFLWKLIGMNIGIGVWLWCLFSWFSKSQIWEPTGEVQVSSPEEFEPSDETQETQTETFEPINETAKEIPPPKILPIDDLICPICLELPWDPVIAEDGCIYDRPFIETHMESQDDQNLKSPVTNLPMGRRLIPVIRIRNHIEILVESGVISGNHAAKWNAKVQEKKVMEKFLAKAEGGDAMFDVGQNYEFGFRGFKQDHTLAFQWYERAHKAGNAAGTASLGGCYLDGKGVARQQSLGLELMSTAADQGSPTAAFILAMYGIDNGRYRFRRLQRGQSTGNPLA